MEIFANNRNKKKNDGNVICDGKDIKFRVECQFLHSNIRFIRKFCGYFFSAVVSIIRK